MTDEPRDMPAPADGRTLRAAEEALGLAPRQMVGRDPALAAAVARWEADLAGLAVELPPVAPADRVWQGIRAGMAPPAPAPAPWWHGVWESLALWRGLAAGAVAAALLLAVLPRALPRPAEAPVATREVAVLLVAALLPRDGPATHVAAYDPRRTEMVLVPAAAPTGPGVPWLWLVPPGEADPIPLGALAADLPTVIPVSAGLVPLVEGEGNLAITLEPAGTTPSGSAPGPVVAHGKLTPARDKA